MSILTLLLSPLWAQSSSSEDLEQVIRGFQQALENVDFSSYGSFFPPEVSAEEISALSLYFSELGMERVICRRLPGTKEERGARIVFFHVLFQNSYAALIETWRLSFVQLGEKWIVSSREITSRLRNLYRLKIPSSRVEKVEKISIDHQDINLSFRNALVFYDNLPEIETALLIIGPGQMTFMPSDLNEKHQLKLMYGVEVLQTEVEYAYLRFSPYFFTRNIKIDSPVSSPAAAPRDLDRASRLFSLHQDRFFTVENSLTQELLTALPQAEEAVFDFKSPRLGNLTYVFSPFSEDEITLYDQNRDRFISLYSPEKGSPGRSMRLSLLPGFDVLHYDLDVEIDPANLYLSARALVHISPRTAGVESVRFRLNPKLKLFRVVDGEGRELVFNQDRASKTVYLPLVEPATAEKLKIEFYYQGRLEPPPSHTDVIALGQAEETRIIVPLKFDSFLYSSSALWYPSPPTDDYFTARVKFTTLANMTCLGQGVLVESGKIAGPRTPSGEKRQEKAFWVYESKQPLKYLAFLFGRVERGQESITSSKVPIELYTTQEFRTNWKGMLEETAAIIEFYERLFGSFPYENLRLVLRFWETKGGHSPGSLVILNQIPRSLSAQGLEGRRTVSPVDLSEWSEYFLAHDLAHQWWGQAITWKRYRDQWLSEGLAQFATIRYLKEKYGSKAYRDIVRRFSQWTQKKSRWGPVILGSRLSYLDFEAFQSIIYNKSSLALHLLSELLGEEKFFRGLKEFVQEFKYRPATTSDFFRTMERVSGFDLKAFAQGWFEKFSLPQVKIHTSLEKKNDQYLFTIRVEQMGDIFVFPLWLEWREEKAGGRREMVVIDKKMQEFHFHVSSKLNRFKVNPGGIVPGKFT